MPESYTNAPREKRVLHADWWSDARDASGQWLERAEVLWPQLERDSQWVQARLNGQTTVSAKNASHNTISMAGTEKYRMWMLMRMVVTLTNKAGVNVLPPANTPEPQRIEWWQGIPKKDTEWLFEQIEEQAEPATPVLPEDEAEAQANTERNAVLIAQAATQGTAQEWPERLAETDPAALADGHFRQIS